MEITRALSIRGWMSKPELLLLAEFASKHYNIIEVGSYCGRSARAIADSTKGRLLCVDPWDGMCQTYLTTWHSNGYRIEFNEFMKNLSDHIASGKVKYAINRFENIWHPPNPDMIFLDAIHEYQAVKDDIHHARELMKHGLLCGHDFCLAWEGVIRAVTEIFPNVKHKETIWYVEL